jgi:hypothetical protein
MSSPFSASFADFVNRLEAFFKGAEDKVAQFATAFLPKAEHLLEVAFEDLAILAGQAVLLEAPKVLSGQEKFGNAVVSVIQQVEASGKTIAIGTAQTAVQTAYLTAQQIASQSVSGK